MRALLAAVLLAPALVLAAPAPDRQLETAEEALDAWDIPAASAYAEDLRRAHPDDARVAHLLGRVRLHQGRYDEAVDLLSEAGVAPDEGTYLDLAKAAAGITRSYAQVESPHFVFRFPRGKDEILAPYALETLERAHDRIGEVLGYRPAGQKILVEVVQDAKELSAVSTLSLDAIKTTNTVAICKFNRLMVISPKALLRGYEWRDTLAHELTHLLITHRSRNRTPIWLHEGIAKYFETTWRGPPGKALELPSQALLRDRVRAKKLITFEQMHPSIALLPTAEDAALAFAEVFTAIEFLHERDATAVSRVLELLGQGRNDRDAVSAVFGQPFPKFEAAWRRHLETRKYPDESASKSSLRLEFKDDPQAPEKVKQGEGWRDLTAEGEFAEIEDAGARRSAHLGELLRARGKPAAAAAKYRAALDRTGARYPVLSNKYAIALLELGHGAEALQVLEGSLVRYPSDALTNLNLARVNMQMGRAALARPYLEQAVSVNPFDPEIHARLAEVAKAQGDEPLRKQALRALALLSGEAAPAPDATPERSVIGWLAIESDVVARVIVDGADTGMTTPVARLPLGPGTHRVRLERVDGAGAKEFDVQVRAGETADLRAALIGS